MIYRLISKKSNELTKNEIYNISKLKNQHFKFGIKSQINWFKNNINKFDIHNILLIQNKIIGYTLLRNKIGSAGNFFFNYFLFDSLIIDKQLRKNGLSKLLMILNHKIIKKNKKASFLICSKKLTLFYKKFGWIKLKPNKFSIIGHNLNKKCGMLFNQNKIIKNKNKLKFSFIK